MALIEQLIGLWQHYQVVLCSVLVENDINEDDYWNSDINKGRQLDNRDKNDDEKETHILTNRCA